MKILFVQYHTGLGGATTSLLQLIARLKEKRFEVSVLVGNPSGYLVDQLNQLSLPVHHLEYFYPYGHGNGARPRFWGYPPFQSLIQLFRLPRSIRSFKQFLEGSSFDLVYINSSILWPAAVAASQAGTPVITHVREVLYQGLLGFRKSILKKLIQKYSHKIIVISEFSKSQFNPKAPVEVVFNAVDFERFDIPGALGKEELRKQLGLDPELKYVLMMGGALPHKGAQILLKAARHLSKGSDHLLRFIILGKTDPYYPQIPRNWKQKLRKLLGADPGQRFLNQLSESELGEIFILPGMVENVGEWLRACDLLVFPATEDHFARPIIEAGYLRVPVVASDGDSCRELVPKERNGLLFVNKSPASLARQIDCVLQDQQLADQMGKSGHTLALKRYDLKNQIETITKIIEEFPSTHDKA